MSEVSDVLLTALRAAQTEPDASVRLATIASASASGATVTFDGETAVSGRVYFRMASARVQVGDRVVMIRTGSTWVVGGIVQGRADIQRGVGTVVYAGATQTQSYTFAHGLGATPGAVTVSVWDNRFILAVTAKDATNITVNALYINGNVLAGFALGFDWIAVR